MGESVKLPNDEQVESQIIVTQLKTGELKVWAKSESEVDQLQFIGMLEAAKFDILSKSNDVVPIELTQFDIDNDKPGIFKGKKAGDTIGVSAQVADFILGARQERESDKQ